VCRPGGRIGLACWTPDGFLGHLFRVIGRYVPPLAGIASPILWGNDSHLRERFADAARIEHTKRLFAFRYRSAAHWIEVFRTFYGPVHKAVLALDAGQQAALERELTALLESLNRGGDRSLVVPGEYLETVITKERDALCHEAPPAG
jgi:hypothetical protein